IAHSGGRALVVLAENRAIDVVITDQSMPGMTGLELAMHIRELCPTMPIVLATGHADLAEGRGLDVRSLIKPFAQEDLAEALAAVVNQDRDPINVLPA